LLCVAATLRIVLAVRPGLWADEIFSVAIATGHSLEHPATAANPALGDFIEPTQAQPPSAFRRYMQHETPPVGPGRVIRAVLLSDTNPPLYYLILNIWTRTAGTSDAALRLFSTVWALACFPLLWALGRGIVGRKAAWIACVLFTFAPRALYYSAEGRMYSLVWFLALSLAWLTFKLARRGPRPHLFLLWSLSGAAGLLTHYFFSFVWLACVAWLWLHPGKVKRTHVLAGAVLTGLMVLPWYLQIPGSLGRWRVTAGWLDHPLSWGQALTAPFISAASFLLGSGVWGVFVWADLVAAGLYALLIVMVLRKGAWHLFSPRRRLLWLWLLASCLGPLIFDLLRDTNASTIVRYALPGLPAAMLLAGLGMSRLPQRAQISFLVMILLTWAPGIRAIFAEPSRPWEPYPEVAARLAASADPSGLIIVHSIPSGVLGVARYLNIDTPLAPWVVQLRQRRVPKDMKALLAGRCRVALVKIHDMGEPSPAEAWFREHAILDRQDRLHHMPLTEILFFLPKSPDGRSSTRCPAWSRSKPSAPGTLSPSARRTAG
jgi:hypothetical protein